METSFNDWAIKAKIIGIYDDFTFKFYDDKIKLVSYKGKQKKLVVPPVNVIGLGAFRYNHYIEEVEIPEEVDTLMGALFINCDNLKRVTLRCKARRISANTFKDCIKLEYVDMGDSITHIGTCAFYNCKSLKQLKLPESLERIDECAFYNTGLIKLKIPSNVRIADEKNSNIRSNLEILKTLSEFEGRIK